MSDDKTRILTAEEAARVAALVGESDDKTRVLSAEEAARLHARAGTAPASEAGAGRNRPRLVADKIVFYCSNGHRIAVNKSLAGKKGNCSKQGCGVPVVIPIPPGLDVPPAEPPAEEPSTGEHAVAASTFDFNAPAGGEQQPAPEGQSPVLPQDDPPPEDGAEAPAWNFVAGGPASGDADQSAVAAVPEVEDAGWAFDVADIEHPTARLVARLWQERAHGGVVEVHLAGGGVIMPEFYDPRWSCGDHAVFAALAADNTVTLTAVAWDQVQRVVVRQVQGKPEGMFGE